MSALLDDDPELAGDETEILSDEDVVYQINTFGADFTVDGLIKRFEKGTIFKPEFQRNFVWSLPQASKFVESILLGLPIPSIFLYREEETQKLLIIDGLQRLTTLHAFYKGRLPHNDRVFKLTRVKSQYEGKTFDELSSEDQLRFEDAVIHAMIVQQLAPDDSNSSVFHIFDRLNSNGTPLQAQEMRAAIYHGKYQNLLGTLNKNPDWRAVFGKEHKRAKDQELILRFLALYYNADSYSKPMATFLNDFMNEYRNPSDQVVETHGALFEDSIGRARAAFGERAFRPQRTFNIAVFDSMMLGIARNPQASAAQIASAYEGLLENGDFRQAISEATSDENSVERRINLACEYIEHAP
ncbi:Protein of unknown function DUF262 [Palleronia salina]|uniref:GmrSD restriction endonucleases N-terminal domain-containing protein n=1 Tax=Palleronia salina TaxID=313368 RepID=A0A1M6BFN5_9RHOB|nr:DUF262 domain-containing protein [Palleronia salina]SHI47506.1 Protein of unknown function DUF262 [Palleronia salina]